MLKKYFNSLLMPEIRSLSFLVVNLIVAGLLLQSCKQGQNSESTELEVTEGTDEGIQLLDLEGNAINLEDYRGKVIFLNFWATWCKPCIAEMPSIEKLSKELGEDGFVFLAASDEKMEKIQRFAEKYPFDFQYVQLKTNVYQLGLSVLPTTYIIDSEGEIVDKIVGAREWDSSESIDMMKSL